MNPKIKNHLLHFQQVHSPYAPSDDSEISFVLNYIPQGTPRVKSGGCHDLLEGEKGINSGHLSLSLDPLSLPVVMLIDIDARMFTTASRLLSRANERTFEIPFCYVRILYMVSTRAAVVSDPLCAPFGPSPLTFVLFTRMREPRRRRRRRRRATMLRISGFSERLSSAH